MTLPNFILGGAPKAGTTSLYHYLDAHPDVFMCPVKEPDFFHQHWDRGVEWYASLFEGHAGETAIGEASPGTLESAEAVERIHGLAPATRFVFVLRDPVERAHSQYLYGVGRGTQSVHTSFGDFIRNESDPWRNRTVALGMYAEQVERYIERFGQQQVHVALFDDLKRDRDGVLRSVFTFIGVDPDAAPSDATEGSHNVTQYPRSAGLYRAFRTAWDPVRARLGPEVFEWLYPVRSAVRGLFFSSNRDAKPALVEADRLYLAALYADSNRRLENLLGRDLSGWTTPSTG